MCAVGVDPTSNTLIDCLGREVYFHGVNVVVKGPPWYPVMDEFNVTWSLAKEDMQLLQSWGMNIVRLGVMWPGASPAPDVINSTYLTLMHNLTQQLATYNIFTLVDCHQDSLATRFCGEGLPLWANPEVPEGQGFPWPLEAPWPVDNVTGIPSPELCAKYGWPEYEVTKAAGVGYQSLYTNMQGFQDQFSLFWQAVARTFRDLPSVVGYELLNEPWAGDVLADPLLLIPGVADRQNLQPMYDRLATDIAQVDPTHLVFFESVTWDDIFPVGFNHTPGGPERAAYSALSYHYYEPPNLDAPSHFAQRASDIQRLGCGGMLTEFSLGVQSDSDVQSFRTTTDLCDAHRQSWIGWDYKGYDPITGSGDCLWFSNGTLNELNIREAARTYAQVVAGRVANMTFNASSGVFDLRFNPLTQATRRPAHSPFAAPNPVPLEDASQSLIYVNLQFHYPNGFTVRITPPGAASYTTQTFPAPIPMATAWGLVTVNTNTTALAVGDLTAASVIEVLITPR